MSLQEETFTAMVTDAADPEERGRIKVTCVGLLGDDEADLPMWVEPSMPWGWFLVPDVGEVVDVVCNTGSTLDEQWGQASLDNLDVRWRGVRHITTDAADEPRPLNDEFKTNYGKRRGFATPAGHVLVFDDTPGDETLKVVHPSGTTVVIDKNGQVTIDTSDKVIINASEVQAGGTKTLAEASNLDQHLSAISADLLAIATAVPTTAPNYGPPAKSILDVSAPVPTSITKGD